MSLNNLLKENQKYIIKQLVDNRAKNAEYFNENINRKDEEINKLKEEIKKLKEEINKLKEENEKLKEETEKLKEEKHDNNLLDKEIDELKKLNIDFTKVGNFIIYS
jgi:predicted RNase H-like nuclease (RuvC/YqgF family)